jgi:hypothetical protein
MQPLVFAAKFNLGDTVEVYNTGASGLVVRDAPAGNYIGGKYDGDRGVVIAGPQNAYLGGVLYTWWKVRWAGDSLEGWSAENWLMKVTPPDLTVEDIWIYPESFNPGSGVTIYTRIKNIGAGAAASGQGLWIKAYFDGGLCYQEGIEGLGAGYAYTFQWGYTWPSNTNWHTIEVRVDPDNYIIESNEGNNIRSESFQATAPPPPNQPPTLYNGYVTPSSGDTSTTFSYYVTYSDPEGDVPTTKYVYVDDSPYTMTKISGDYVSGAVFRYSTTLSVGLDHNYYFYFADSVHSHTVRLPTTGTISGPTVPPPPEYRTLTVYSSPSGVSFTANGVSHTTPWSGTYSQDTSVNLVMPSAYVAPSGDAMYFWQEWSDGVTNESRTVVLNSDVIVTGCYIGPYYTLTISSSPASGIPFTLNGAAQTTFYNEMLYQGYYTIEMPATYGEYVWQQWLEDSDTNRIKTVLLTHSTWLTACYLTPLDFSISAFPVSLTAPQGGDGSSTITISSINGFNDVVGLFCSGMPTGVWSAFVPEVVVPPADGSATSTLFVNAEWTVQPGSYSLTVTGTSGALQHNISIALEIAARSPFTFSPATPKSGDIVTFTATGAYDWYLWDFGDGEEIETTQSTVTHRFRGAMVDSETYEPMIKQYSVRLTMEDKDQNPIFTGQVPVSVEPLTKTMPINPGLLGVDCGLKATYNWVRKDETSGRDIYMISRFDSWSYWLCGAYVFGVLHRVNPSDTYRSLIWSKILISTPDYRIHPYTEFNLVTYSPSGDGMFMGIEVTDTDSMGLYALGNMVPSFAPPYFMITTNELAMTQFNPTSPVENIWKPKELEGSEWITLLNSLYEFTGWTMSPCELRIYDSQGRVTGFVNGQIREEIPDSAVINGTVIILNPTSSYRYDVIGSDPGEYGLRLILTNKTGDFAFAATNIPTSSNTVHEYSVDWAALFQGEEGVTVKVDSNGDGVFEYTFTSDSELTRNEFLIQTGQSVLYTFSTVWGEETFVVSVESNSTVSDFAFGQPDKQISFSVAGEVGTIGFCNVTIPKALLYGEPWTVLVDGAPVSSIITESATHSYLYFTYAHSTHEVQIIGTWVIGPLPPPLSVSISPLSASILVGHSVTFASTVSGGYTPYTYQWYLNGNPVSGATSDIWAFTPTTGGIYYIHLKATDAIGNTTQSETARIVVTTVPVGGYSVSIQLPTTAKPVTIHIALLMILTALFIKIKRKAKRKH